ncbi:PREDICTED: uncharacterized protein LOC104744883 isoform X3 [Camelina sativa]|uniref:Uncharacterized protein LOC104744883 isoform X3 n=1 Tax=Camelina sativa TaxID=90675 RepID=A0ABM1R0A2_CAMSA|nr:PREDICTED: uncharacterized protein LOC104744883 isoform X3 [Camelina sativa]
MDRYKRVDKPKPESPINENEIRITSQGLIRNYISYATSLLQEKGVKDIVLKAMGQAISKTVAISEILKNKIPGLHQDIAISSMSITDVWEPMEEGLVPVELTRHVSMISITLSLSELNKDSPGYQAPAQTDQSKPQYQPQQGRQARVPYNAYGEGDGEVVAEEEAGEEVDMEITKRGIKEITKGTIKKIIKKMKARIQTGAEAVDVVDGVMALVALDIRVAEVGMMVAEMTDMVEEGTMDMVRGEMTDMVEEGTMDMVEEGTMDTMDAEMMGMGVGEADFEAAVLEVEVMATLEAEMKDMGEAEAEVMGTVEAEVMGTMEAEVMGTEEAEVIGTVEEEVMGTVEDEVMGMEVVVTDMEEIVLMVMRAGKVDTVDVEVDMVEDVEGWVMVAVQGVVLVTKTKPKLFDFPFSKLYG